MIVRHRSGLQLINHGIYELFQLIPRPIRGRLNHRCSRLWRPGFVLFCAVQPMALASLSTAREIASGVPNGPNVPPKLTALLSHNDVHGENSEGESVIVG